MVMTKSLDVTAATAAMAESPQPIVWLVGGLPGAEPVREMLAARGYTVYGASQLSAYPDAVETPDAVVYLAPPPKDDLTSVEIPTYTSMLVAQFLMLAQRTVERVVYEGRSAAVVAVCNITGIPGHHGNVAEATASGALIGASKCLAKELGRHKISVNTLCYGFIPALNPEDNLTTSNCGLLEMMQLGKSGSLDHLVNNLSHLINNRHFMTGQVLQMADGLIM